MGRYVKIYKVTIVELTIGGLFMWKYFKDLERSMTLRDLNELSAEIADQYADRENHDITKKELAEMFEMTPNLVGKLLDYAVINRLVPEATVKRMEDRSVHNQKQHSPDRKATTAKEHYSSLRRKRIEMEVFGVSEETIKEIATRFANECDKTKEDFALEYQLDKSAIDVILKKAITENICDDETFKKIEERSLKHNNTPVAEEFFKQLHERREAKKKNFFA